MQMNGHVELDLKSYRNLPARRAFVTSPRPFRYARFALSKDA